MQRLSFAASFSCSPDAKHDRISKGARRVRLLVTGHHGYIGSVVAPMLQEAGHEVVGMDTFFYEGCDAVVHLAALSNDPLGDFDKELTYDINLRGTLHLAAQAKSAGVKRFIF